MVTRTFQHVAIRHYAALRHVPRNNNKKVAGVLQPHRFSAARRCCAKRTLASSASTAAASVVTEDKKRNHEGYCKVIQYPALAELKFLRNRKSGEELHLVRNVTVFVSPQATDGSEEKSANASTPPVDSANHGWIQVEETDQKPNADYLDFFSPATVQGWIRHFLPANYPHSVGPGYAKYSLAAFCASVAGSAGMVLSTQCLLLAVGIVGTTQKASVMAGALNWVIKDGIGQLGGVLFASRVGESKRFDANPKRWRLVAAVCLDAASLTELLAPLVLGSLVLPLACGANVLKNIGFLTASASRAALHQSLAVSRNLADVTVKAGSQTVAAALLGTGLGIGLSMLLGHDAIQFASAFGVLVLLHQGCTYISLSAVDLRYFDKHRMYLLLRHYVQSEGNTVLSPQEVAQMEVFFPLVHEDDTHKWLSIGSALETIAPGGYNDLQERLEENDQPYILNSKTADGRIHLTFLSQASGEDLILGMLHAVHLREHQHLGVPDQEKLSARAAKKHFPELFNSLHQRGWMTGSDETSIEPSGAFRLNVSRP